MKRDQIYTDYDVIQRCWKVFVPDELVEAVIERPLMPPECHRLKETIGLVALEHLRQPGPELRAARARVKQNNNRRFPWLRARP